jgi:hypothetical protein
MSWVAKPPYVAPEAFTPNQHESLHGWWWIAELWPKVVHKQTAQGAWEKSIRVNLGGARGSLLVLSYTNQSKRGFGVRRRTTDRETCLRSVKQRLIAVRIRRWSDCCWKDGLCA